MKWSWAILLSALGLGCGEQVRDETVQRLAGTGSCALHVVSAETIAAVDRVDRTVGTGYGAVVVDVAVAVDGTVFGLDDRAVRWWPGAPGSERVLSPRVHLPRPSALAYAPEDDRLYVATAEGLTVFDAASSGEARVWNATWRRPARRLATAPDGGLYATVEGEPGRIYRLFPPIEPGHNPRHALDDPAFGAVEGMATDARGALYVVSGGDTIAVVDSPGAGGVNRAITLAGASLTDVWVSLDGTGYLADPDRGRVYEVAGVSAASGRVAPRASIPLASARRVTGARCRSERSASGS